MTMRKWTLLALIAATILIGDQISKYLAVEHLTGAPCLPRRHDRPG